jgi:hypothetical protein
MIIFAHHVSHPTNMGCVFLTLIHIFWILPTMYHDAQYLSF